MSNRMTIKDYIHDYKFNSLFFKNLKHIFLLMIVPIIGAGFLAYFAYNNMQKNEIHTYSNEITDDIYNDFYNILKSSQSELMYIGMNSNVELYLYETANIKQFNQRITSIQDLIRLPVISKDYIDNVYIYSFANDKILSLNAFEDYEVFSQRAGLDVYLSGDLTDTRIMATTKDRFQKQLTIYQPLRYGKHTYGVAFMDLNIEELDALFPLSDTEAIFLIGNDKVLYSTHKNLIGSPRDDIPEVQLLSEAEPLILDNHVSNSMKFPESNIEIITYLNLNGYHNQLAAVRNFMILFLILMFLIMFLLAISISIRIFHPIDEIMREIRKNQPVLIGESELIEEQNELNYILSSIKKTTHLKQTIDQELKDRVLLLKKAQSIALQSQINPHFLNNTLDTINWISIGLLGGKNQISEMTTALSRMLRMSLENTDSIIPLAKEIEHCNYYIEIQNIRYEGKFKLKWNIPDELYQYKTIRIILQPVVENAIYHGVKYLRTNGLITISGKADNGTIVLIVEDNGLGINEQEVAELAERINTESIKESKHIGLANVNQRIRLYFGEEYGISIESQEGLGTRVFIRFPQIL